MCIFLFRWATTREMTTLFLSDQTHTQTTHNFMHFLGNLCDPHHARYSVNDMTVQIPRELVGQLVHVFIVTDVGLVLQDANRTNNHVRVTDDPLNLTSVTAESLVSAGVVAVSAVPGNGTLLDPALIVIGSVTEFRLCTKNTGPTTAIGPWYVRAGSLAHHHPFIQDTTC